MTLSHLRGSLEQGRHTLDHVREYLSQLDIQKSMGPDGMHPLLFIIFDQSWQLGKVYKDWGNHLWGWGGAQWGCRESDFGNFQNPSGQGLGQPALSDPAWARCTNIASTRSPCQLWLFCDSVKKPNTYFTCLWTGRDTCANTAESCF